MSEEETKDALETEAAAEDSIEATVDAAAEAVDDAAAKAPAEAVADAVAEASAAGKKKKRWPIVVGVVVVVLIAAVAGGLAWHEQPSFCNAICHMPMDGYLETYEATPGQPAKDKWGDDVADASGMMASVHRAADSNITCLTCHEPTMSEQLSEGVHWLTGSYNVWQTSTQSFVPSERDFAQLTEARGATSEALCLKSGCHENSDGTVMTRDDLVELTKDEVRNPHEQPHGEVACGECHKAHRASTVYCSKCHNDATIPEGWVSYSEAESVVPVSLEGDSE